MCGPCEGFLWLWYLHNNAVLVALDLRNAHLVERLWSLARRRCRGRRLRLSLLGWLRLLARPGRCRVALLRSWSTGTSWSAAGRSGRRDNRRTHSRYCRRAGGPFVTSRQLRWLLLLQRRLESDVRDRRLLLQLVGPVGRRWASTGRGRRHMMIRFGMVEAWTAGLTIIARARWVGGNTMVWCSHRPTALVRPGRTHGVDAGMWARRSVISTRRWHSACRSTGSAEAWSNAESRRWACGHGHATTKIWRAVVHWVGGGGNRAVIGLNGRRPVLKRIGRSRRGAGRTTVGWRSDRRLRSRIRDGGHRGSLRLPEPVRSLALL